MKIKAYEKVAVGTLHVAGVKDEYIEKFKALTKESSVPGSFYVNQMMEDFFRSVEKQEKQAKTAAAA